MATSFLSYPTLAVVSDWVTPFPETTSHLVSSLVWTLCSWCLKSTYWGSSLCCLEVIPTTVPWIAQDKLVGTNEAGKFLVSCAPCACNSSGLQGAGRHVPKVFQWSAWLLFKFCPPPVHRWLSCPVSSSVLLRCDVALMLATGRVLPLLQGTGTTEDWTPEVEQMYSLGWFREESANL